MQGVPEMPIRSAVTTGPESGARIAGLAPDSGIFVRACARSAHSLLVVPIAILGVAPLRISNRRRAAVSGVRPAVRFGFARSGKSTSRANRAAVAVCACWRGVLSTGHMTVFCKPRDTVLTEGRGVLITRSSTTGCRRRGGGVVPDASHDFVVVAAGSGAGG